MDLKKQKKPKLIMSEHFGPNLQTSESTFCSPAFLTAPLFTSPHPLIPSFPHFLFLRGSSMPNISSLGLHPLVKNNSEGNSDGKQTLRWPNNPEIWLNFVEVFSCISGQVEEEGVIDIGTQHSFIMCRRQRHITQSTV